MKRSIENRGIKFLSFEYSLFRLLILILVLPAIGIKDLSAQVDNRAVTSGRNDVVYLAPATETYEALPLGNGQLGVMLRNENGLTYLFNHGNFFSSSDEAGNLISSGEFSIQLPDSWLKGFQEERLALYDAKIITKYKTRNDSLIVTSWMAEGLDILIVEIESNQLLPDLKLGLSGQDRLQPNYHPIDVTDEIKKIEGPLASKGKNEIYLTTIGVGAKRATSIMALVADEMGTNFQANSINASMQISSSNRKKISIFVANPVIQGNSLTFADAEKESKSVVKKAIKTGIAKLRENHNKFWHEYWGKSTLLMHSEDGLADYIENLHHLFLYWMAGCSRGMEAPKFNGGNYIFQNDWRSWGGSYWFQNTREMYWPLLSTGHSELWKPFLNLYSKNLPAAQRLAKDLFDAPGACFNEVMDRNGKGDKGSNPYVTLYHTTGTELGHQFYQYYLYTRDESFLKETVYPILKETLTFHLSFFNKEKDGLYHIYPTNSRETYWWIKDAITDLVAVKTCLPILISLSEKLNVDSERRNYWIEVLNYLAPLQVDQKKNVFLPGTFLGEFPPTKYTKAEKVYPPEKRSSLASNCQNFNFENITCEPMFPWGLIGLKSTGNELETAKNTFLNRTYNIWHFGIAWDPSVLFAARLGLPDEIVKSYSQFIKYDQFFPNGMSGTPGNCPKEWGGKVGDSPGFDGAGVAAMGAIEMQLQSYGGLIRIYPAWPKGWASEFDLFTEGGFKIKTNISQSGVIGDIHIKSLFGQKCEIVNPWEQGAILIDEAGNKKVYNEAKIEFETKAEKSYTLKPRVESLKMESIICKRNTGPKWPFHSGVDDTVESYLGRTKDFGLIGIPLNGEHPAKLVIEGKMKK